MVVAYATVEEDVQSTIFTIINNDTTSITFHNNETGTLANNVTVLDGIPQNLVINTGFPYVLVQTPYITEERSTKNKFGLQVTSPIEIFDKKEKNVRRIIGAIRSALSSNQATTRAIHLTNMLIKSTPMTRTIGDTSKIYNGHLRVRYKVYVGVNG